MRITLVSLCLLTAACGSGASTPGSSVDNVARPPVVTGPAPTVAWGEFGFTLTGLPAVSADGTKIALPVILEDGGRGFPNLEVVIKDRADAIAHQQVVLGIDEQAMDQPPPTQAALDDANAYLARTHADQNWQPMALLEGGHDEESGERLTTLRGDGVEITWAAPRLTISASGAVVFDREFPAWEAAPQSAGDEPCSNPSYLSFAYLDAARKIAVVRISYEGTDSCWEPDSQQHVVAW